MSRVSLNGPNSIGVLCPGHVGPMEAGPRRGKGRPGLLPRLGAKFKAIRETARKMGKEKQHERSL
jgi:hypothetical protein